MTRAIALLALTLLLTACAGAPLPVQMPPPQYDHAPFLPYITLLVPLPNVDAVCRANGDLGASGQAIACTLLRARPIIILPMVEPGFCSKDDQARLLRHEIAHINGWPRSHPGAL
jgi:hypothetical protein